MSNRNWVFTLNNYTEEELQQIQQFAVSKDCNYLIYGIEKGDAGTPHLQGYFEYSKKSRLTGIRQCSTGFSRAHLEPRRGTAAQASEYCKKDGNFREYGKIASKRQGQRFDLQEIQDDIKAGAQDLEIANNYFTRWVVYRNSFNEYRKMVHTVPRTWKTVVVVLWGTTGTGKTRFVFQQRGDRELFVHGGDRWFDGYVGQPLALFDDFDGTQLEFRMFLRLLDRYPMQVPIKGGFANWAPKKIYITSNLHPKQWYQDTHDQSLPALMRRITIIHEIRDFIFN